MPIAYEVVMKAVRFHRHGGPEVLQYEDAPDPTIGDNDVLVKVKACALNHLDIWVRKGLPNIRITLPHISGSDVAGEIVAVGKDVKKCDVGELVVLNPSLGCGKCEFCIAGEDSLCVDFMILGEHVDGGLAELAKAPERNVVRLPFDFPLVEAAAAPLTFMTAWRMLVTKAQIRPGEDVLILGAGAGVSAAAVQIAKLAGANVFVTSSSDEKLRKSKELGADILINYEQMEFDQAVWELTGGRGVDVVVDHVGRDTWMKSLRCLRRGGRMVTCGATTGALGEVDIRYVFWRQLSILGSTMASHRELEDVMRLVFMRKLKPVVDRVLPLEKAPEAEEILEMRKQFGKIVLTP